VWKLEFELKKNEQKVAGITQDDFDLAFKFSKRMYQEFGDLLKAIVLFGSNVKGRKPQSNPEFTTGENQHLKQGLPPEPTPGSAPQPKQEEKNPGDIDILVVVDDVTVQLTPELVETYRIIVKKVILDISPRIHVTSLKLTSFWAYIRAGDPVGLNILREGVALLDSGFFDPLKALLRRGMIRPSPESVFTYFARAPRTLYNSKWHILQATVDLYWAVIDAAHSALMALDEVPPSPEHVAQMLEEKLVKPGHINRKYVATVSKFFRIYKGITRREIKEVSGAQYDSYYREAEEFVKAMKGFINLHGLKPKL